MSLHQHRCLPFRWMNAQHTCRITVTLVPTQLTTDKKMRFIVQLSLLVVLASWCRAGTPAPEIFYDDQKVDHDDPSDYRRWSQRYYTWGYEWWGPGNPIFVIIGGEGNIEPSTGIVYPFIAGTLASKFGAFVLQPEHRFYGKSIPVEVDPAYDPREKLLTPAQALKDAMRLVRHYQRKLHCSLDRSSPAYCPVITVGGSYPGYLSAMARLLFPQVVDMAYSGSAPMKFYAQQLDSGAYYNHITKVAEKAMPGCANAVSQALNQVNDVILEQEVDFHDLATSLGFCAGTIPSYIQSAQTFANELFMVVAYCVANDNMAFYPPNESTRFYQMCSLFSSARPSILKIREFLAHRLPTTGLGCVDMLTQLPTGPNATISGGDW